MTNEIFAHYIVNSMPVGIRGLIIAGVFATMMGSTLGGPQRACDLVHPGFLPALYQPGLDRLRGRAGRANRHGASLAF